ncbi:MAG TPA: glycosyltransferase 87 family protein [Methanomassiliicoccales archaeon]|nr:glycosyltransferase 87 family protein [Methanomassiliicoccales archaeon]
MRTKEGQGDKVSLGDRLRVLMLKGDLKRKLLAIVILGLLIYGLVIALDGLLIRPLLGDVLSDPTDLDFYRARASNILEGKVPYVDFTSESPPLIMYLFTIPQLTGGSVQAYQLFFTAFAILTSATFFLLLRRYDERKAMAASILYLVYPLGMMEFGFGVQDESITIFLFVLPLLLLLHQRAAASGAASFLGVLTKMFNVIVLPWTFLHSDNKGRLNMVLAFGFLALVVILPFMLLYPGDLPSFTYYFLGHPETPTGGSSISPWHYLGELGFGLPGWAGVALTLVGLGAASLYAYWKKLSLWQGATLVTMVFFLTYPKILLVYFMMPGVLLLMWGVEDRKVVLKLTAMLVPLFLSVAITGNGKVPMMDGPGVWLIGIVLSLVGWALFVHAWWKVKDERPFFERAEG